MGKRMGRLLTSAALTTMCVPLVIASTASTAHAHYSYVYQGDDFASVSSDHLSISVCDRENDGNYVFAEYLRNNDPQYLELWDTTYGGACRTNTRSPGVRMYRLCEAAPSGDACSAWRDA